jgi:hypothetical protein
VGRFNCTLAVMIVFLDVLRRATLPWAPRESPLRQLSRFNLFRFVLGSLPTDVVLDAKAGVFQNARRQATTDVAPRMNGHRNRNVTFGVPECQMAPRLPVLNEAVAFRNRTRSRAVTWGTRLIQE